VVVGDWTYIASEEFGLSVAHTVNIDDPVITGSSDILFAGKEVAVDGADGTVAVVGGIARDNGENRLWVVDVSNKAAPVVQGELAMPAAVKDVVMNSSGSMAVVAVGSYGIKVIDVSNPAAPSVMGSYDTPGTAWGVALNSTGTVVYVADGSGGFKVVSLSNPQAPVLLGSYSLSGRAYISVAVEGVIAGVVNNLGTLDTIDVSNPSAPQFRGTEPLNGWGYDVAVEGSRAAVICRANDQDYIAVIDISNPFDPVREGTITGALQTFSGVDIAEGYVYVAAGGEGMKIYDITNPAAPSLEFAGGCLGEANDITVDTSYAYVADFPATISIIDLNSGE